MNNWSDHAVNLRRWLRSHPVAAFPLLYLGWAYAFWTPVLLSDTTVWAPPNLIWFLAGGASPLFAGLLLAAITGGTARLRDLGRRLTDWRRIGVRWWLAILLFWLGFDLAMSGAAAVFGLVQTPIDVHWSLWTEPGRLMFLLLLSFVFPAVEELGLRGVYLDALRQRLGLPAAAIVNGAVWACWNAPFVAFPGYYANTSFDPQLWWWLPMIMCHSVLIAYVYTSTGRSLLAALVFHGMMNFTGEWLRLAPEMHPLMLPVVFMIAALVAISCSNGRSACR